MICPATEPLAILNEVFGYPAFRGAQQPIIEHVTRGGDALVLMPTGGGKSLCYQVPAIVRHRAGQGVTIVVSPLIALMHDQVGALEEAGVHAAFLNSSQSLADAQRIEREMTSGRLVLLYAAPERLTTPRMQAQLDSLHERGLLSLFAIDEAHCVSQWGARLPRGVSGLKRAARAVSGRAARATAMVGGRAPTGALSQNWRQWWAEALLFDALIGNSDRHQDNWGLIFDAVGREPPNMPPCRLAPLFDNGTSLGHERFPIRVAGWTDARLDQYIDKGTHHVKSSLSTEHGIQGHLSLLRYVLNHWSQHIDLDLLRGRIDFSQDDLILCIADLVHLPVAVPMTTERMRFVCRLTVRRHALLRALLNAPAEPSA